MQIRPSVHLKKFLSDVLPSLQRVLLTIQPYDFEIKYIPGKEVALTDAVSRVKPQDEIELKGLDFTTCQWYVLNRSRMQQCSY